MTGGGEQRRSLWADPEPDEPVAHPDVVTRVLDDEPEAPPPRPPKERRKVSPRAWIIGAIAAVVIVALASAMADHGKITVTDVPSSWDTTAMTCDTTRIERGARAFEIFRCHALGGGTLPPGIYTAPGSRWNSDIDRRAAVINAMEISRDGQLTGWAVY
jgi:hypothetical protein